MATIETIAIADIAVKDRLRPIDEEHAKAISISIADVGLINPVTVRRTPASKEGKFTLVAGGHRLRACELAGMNMVDAVVVASDKSDAQIIEISENFFRNDLSVIDRGLFGERLREIWEEKNGTAKSRSPKKEVGTKLALTFSEKFSDYVATRLGVSNSAAKRLHRIATHLHPALRDKLRGTKYADNESLLLSLVRVEFSKQAAIAAALAHEPDVKKVLKLVQPEKGRQDRKSWNRSRFLDAWALMNAAEKQEVLEKIGAMMKPSAPPERTAEASARLAPQKAPRPAGEANWKAPVSPVSEKVVTTDASQGR